MRLTETSRAKEGLEHSYGRDSSSKPRIGRRRQDHCRSPILFYLKKEKKVRSRALDNGKVRQTYRGGFGQWSTTKYAPDPCPAGQVHVSKAS